MVEFIKRLDEVIKNANGILDLIVGIFQLVSDLRKSDDSEEQEEK